MRKRLPPYHLVRSIDHVRKFLLMLNRKMFPGNVVLYEQFQNIWLLPSLYIAAELDIAGLLRDGPMTVEELAGRTGTDPSSLYRVLRALASEGIFRQKHDKRFVLNRRSRNLLEGYGSLRHMLMQHLGPANWRSLGELMYSVRTGKDAFSRVHGKEMYSFLKEHPDQFELFEKSMNDLSDLGLDPVLGGFPFRKYRTLVDIGGGEGYLLSHILMENPGMKGILFDLPEALEKAPALLEKCGVTDHVTIVPGNFLESVPVTAELFLMKNILHNWNDENVTIILENTRKAMSRESRLLVIEMIVPPGNKPSTSKLLDIQMLASFSQGKERTLSEYRDLAALSGLRIHRVHATIAPVSLIEMVIS